MKIITHPQHAETAPNKGSPLVSGSSHNPNRIIPELLPTLRKALCYNQGTYLEYSARAHKLHKELRFAFDGAASVETLREHLLVLNNFLDDGIDKALRNTCDFLDRVFYIINPHSTLPRICIKSNKKENQKELIFDVYRHYYHAVKSPGVSCHKAIFPIVDNTGYNYVACTGFHYLESDIPHAVLSKSGYKNPRLDNDKARNYTPPSLLTRIFSGGRDRAWEQCWRGYDNMGIGTSPPEACYKSTLIVPIGLSRSQLSDGEILNTIHTLFPHAIDLKSLIFAYLCFDHTTTHYFTESLHVESGYLFAYMLSLYFCTRWTLTVASHTYRGACSRVEQCDVVKLPT